MSNQEAEQLMLSAEQAGSARESLSQELTRLRHDAKLTGAALALAIGISQSKASKIEKGRLLPIADDVARWAHACGASPAVAKELTARCAYVRANATATRIIIHRGAHRRQVELLDIAKRARSTREVAISVVPALLRTEAYERGVLGSLPERDAHVGLTALRRRQALLGDPTKRFDFLISESALRTPLVSVAVMRDQVDRIASLLDAADPGQATIELAIVPLGTPIHVPVRSGFQIYDQRWVVLELAPGNAILTKPSDVHGHLNDLSQLRRSAVHGGHARELLTRIREGYTGGGRS